MIQRISIRNVATFDPTTATTLDDLRQFNYIFGSNGTGKTTISRVIADAAFSPDCSCTWKDGTSLECLVLNRDFVDKNFGQLRGVFTLGADQKDTQERIDAAKQERDTESEKLTNLKNSLDGEHGNGGKKSELAQLEADFQEKCWSQKQKHDEKLHGAFTGYRNNAQNFKRKVLEEAESNSAELKGLAELEKRANTLFGEQPTRQTVIQALDISSLQSHESNPILQKKVLGKEDIDIAAIIKKLGNSDWVRQGIPYHEQNNQVCPFCQQTTTEQFAESLNEYFDETFEQDSKAIDSLMSEYDTAAAAVQNRITEMIDAPGKFLDADKMKTQKALLDQRIQANQQKLAQKKREPSQVVELESLDEVLTSIKELIDAANVEITRHNATVENLVAEKRTLTAEVWRFVLNELDVDLTQYQKKKQDISQAINGIEARVQQTTQRINEKKREIRDLEKQTTSIQPTVDAINGILSQFGFVSFRLAADEDGKHYMLIRENGENAANTLSEGEKTFVVFLYFFHLLKGSMENSGMTTDRVVVFDDPVSSLDSDVLFIVSSLIRELIESCRKREGHIQQVIVLTHNVYFHKEVTFDRRPKANRPNDETFWVVRKEGSSSTIERHEVNPIKTSYELLWMELRNGVTANPRIENTLRRILEHYFTILGSIDRDQICSKFEGEDKIVCKSLFSWVNAGSHSAFDDAHYTPGGADTQTYLRVFKAIFEKTDHLAHYKMMIDSAA